MTTRNHIVWYSSLRSKGYSSFSNRNGVLFYHANIPCLMRYLHTYQLSVDLWILSIFCEDGQISSLRLDILWSCSSCCYPHKHPCKERYLGDGAGCWFISLWQNLQVFFFLYFFFCGRMILLRWIGLTILLCTPRRSHLHQFFLVI